MSEIQSIADPFWVKYLIMVVAGLFTIVNGLVVFIFNGVKNEVTALKKRSDRDHDRLNILETTHNVIHRK